MPNNRCNINLPNSSARTRTPMAMSQRPFIIGTRARRYGPREWTWRLYPVLTCGAYKNCSTALSGKLRFVWHECGDVIIRCLQFAPRNANKGAKGSDVPPSLGGWRSDLDETNRAWRQDPLLHQPLRSEFQGRHARPRLLPWLRRSGAPPKGYLIRYCSVGAGPAGESRFHRKRSLHAKECAIKRGKGSAPMRCGLQVLLDPRGGHYSPNCGVALCRTHE